MDRINLIHPVLKCLMFPLVLCASLFAGLLVFAAYIFVGLCTIPVAVYKTMSAMYGECE